jgi:hypothetical protein
LLALSCAPGPRGAAAPLLENDLPAVSRVVLQQVVERESYQLLEPSGRFAVFDNVVVDLPAERVAWLHHGGILPSLTADGHVLRSHAGREEGVELWHLVDGSTQLFLGSLVPHVAAAGRVALQRGQALDVVDTVLGQRVALLPALGTILSVVPSSGGWRILARTGQRREQPGLVLLSTPPAPADDLKTVALELPPARFSLAGGTAYHSDPFLSIEANGALRAHVVEACATCPAPAQFNLWSSTIDERSGEGTPWTDARFDLEHPPELQLPLTGPHVPSSAPLPPSVANRLESMRGTASAGTLIDISPDGRRALTGASDRVCVWSLDRAERIGCEHRGHQLYQFMDPAHVWAYLHDDEAPELALWNLKTRQVSRRPFAAGCMLVPGRDQHFLAYRYRTDDRTYDIELWRFASARAVWAHAGCAAPPYFAARGAHVVCPAIDIASPVLLLDTRNGRVLDASAPRPAVAHLPQACELDTSDGRMITSSRRGQTLVTLYDLTPTEWAIVLPDGRFVGTAAAPSYLAFYGRSGEVRGLGQVERLRDPVAVQTVLAELAGIASGCISSASD